MYTYKHTLHACYIGYVAQAIVNNLAAILFIVFQTQFAASFEMIGRLILINFTTQICADIFAVKYADRIGYRPTTIAAHVFCATGLIGLGVFPLVFPDPYLGLVAAVIIYAIGGGLIEVLISPIVDALPGDAKASAMSLLHSFYCWGQLTVVIVTTLLLWTFGMGIWFILPILWSLVPIYNIFRFAKVPLVPPIPAEYKTPIKSLLTTNIFVVAMVLMICAGASELTMSQWSSLFAELGLQVPKVVGDLLGPALFAMFMGIGRTIYGVWGHKIHLKSALLASAILCVVCYAVTVFAAHPLVSLMGCASCGLTVALMWPGTFSLTAASFPLGGTALFGILAICGDIGAATGPWMAGVASQYALESSRLLAYGAVHGLSPDQVSLRFGLLVAMVFPITAIIGLLVWKERIVTAEPIIAPTS